MALIVLVSEIIVWLAVIFLLIQIVRVKRNFSTSWKFMFAGFLLFLISQFLEFLNLKIIFQFKHSIGILSAITLMYGIWSYYSRVFIRRKKVHVSEDSFIKHNLIISSIVIELLIITVLPQYLILKNASLIPYFIFLEHFFWIIIGVFGIIYVINLKLRLPKLFLIYFIHIKRTTDILLFLFPLMIFWNLVGILYEINNLFFLNLISEAILKPFFVLLLMLLIYYSIVTKIIKTKNSKSKSLELLRVENVMIKNPATCLKSISIKEAAKKMFNLNIGSLIVLDDLSNHDLSNPDLSKHNLSNYNLSNSREKLIGIITERDLLVAHSKEISSETKIEKIMSSNLIIINYSKSIHEAIRLMQEKKVKHLPVIKENNFVGIITETALLDIINNFAFEISHIIDKRRLIDIVDDERTTTLKLEEIMKKEVVTASKDETIFSVLNKMKEQKIGSVVVMDKEEVVGIFTEHDAIPRIIIKKIDVKKRKVGDVCIKIHRGLSPDMTVIKATEIMKIEGMKRMPVIENKVLVGIVTQGMLLSKLNKLASKIVSVKISNPEKYYFKKGVSYIIQDKDMAYKALSEKATNGISCLCITRTIPSQLKKDYNLASTPILWLTQHDEKNVIKPTEFDKLSFTLNRFLSNVENGVILLDGVEYLINYTSFNETLHLLNAISDSIAIHNANLLIIINPKAIDEKEFGIFERSMEIFDRKNLIY